MRSARQALTAVSPWSGVETARVGGGAALGIGIVVVGWWGTAQEAALPDQVPWLSLATIGFAVAAWAAVRWVLHGRMAVGDRIVRVLPAGAAEPTDDCRSPATTVVLGPSPARVHRPGCALAARRGWPVVEAQVAAVAGRARCGVCRP